ncbi:hypothetical protein MASR2M15_11470 [Anaerolineales bacterium]
MNKQIPNPLIEANIALYEGDIQNVNQYLDQLDNETIESWSIEVLWLRANASIDLQTQKDLLTKLIVEAPLDNIYSELARDYLTNIEKYAIKPSQGRSKSFKVGLGIGLSIVAALLFILISPLLNPPVALDELISDEVVPTPELVYEDRSLPMVSSALQARIDAGLIQLVAVEDNSQRVFDPRSLQILKPIDGARWLAYQMVFECRKGICSNPPESVMILTTRSGEQFYSRDDLTLMDDEQFQPLALGRLTRGWVVFEIPQFEIPVEITILSKSDDLSLTPVAVTIVLPAS